MPEGGGRDEAYEVGRITRKVTARAIRRLSLLEGLMMGAAAVLALVGGAGVAFQLQRLLAWPFRPTWAASSLLFFIIPAFVAWLKARRS